MSTFPYQEFVYLGDTARLPYGNKSPETLRRFVHENLRWMEDRRVSSVVVACNSASTVLGDLSGELSFPVFDVIGPGARAGVAATRTKAVAVLATRATVSSNAYLRAIHAVDPAVSVVQVPCPLLVPLVEEGWVEDPITRLVLERYLAPLQKTNVDTVILGCTHFPVLKTLIAELLGPQISIVESGPAVAEQMKMGFAKSLLGGSVKALLPRIYVTDLLPQFGVLAAEILGPECVGPIEVTSVAEEKNERTL